MKLGNKFAAAALLLVALILVNYLASSLPVRLDATADDIYTLSAGTKSILKKIDEPIQLDLYFSKSVEALPIRYKNFATRVEETLRQYVRASKGKLQLNVIDPRPDTPEEEKAGAAGLSPQLLPSGEKVYFGLVATQADQQKTITAFAPQREQFLEYDLSQLIYTVQEVDKKKLGLITSLPLQGSPAGMPPMMMRQQPRESQFVLSEWERTFDIQSIEATATELPANLDALAIIHPENLSQKLQFAIDQFILSGKPVFIAVDPASQYFKRQGGQMAMYGGPQPNVSSDLPELFKAYGIGYDPQKLVGDLEAAAEVSTGQGQVVRYPIWLALTKQEFNAKSLPTAQLNSILFVESGFLNVKSEAGVNVTPLIESSPQAGEVQSMSISMAAPENVAGQIKPTGKKTLAALIQGKLKSAFPNGAPEDAKSAEKPASDKSTDAAKKSSSAAAPASTAATTPANPEHLTESKGTSTIIVVADTDWLLDDYSVRRLNFLGGVAEPLNDNLAFGSNSLEFLSGSQDLVSIRGKGSSVRPFTVVRAMEAEANKKYQQKLTDLDAQLSRVQEQLNKLQNNKTDTNRLVASPEVTKSIEDFRRQQANMRAERRAIRKALREEIEGLGNRLLVMNLVLSPLLLGVFALWFYRHRRTAKI
ncbi:MAG TPA: GldG family protein [Opitutaceae bacterium]|nr:GldG family protein [Opitutaceae bacterium]